MAYLFVLSHAKHMHLSDEQGKGKKRKQRLGSRKLPASSKEKAREEKRWAFLSM